MSSFPSSPFDSPLTTSKIRLYLVNYTDYRKDVGHYYALLNNAEKQHVGQLAVDDLRYRFIITYGILRCLLAQIDHTSPDILHLTRNPHQSL